MNTKTHSVNTKPPSVNTKTHSSPSTLAVLRRGFRETPELRKGIAPTIAAALLSSAGQLIMPIIGQVAIDNGFTQKSDGTANVNLTYITTTGLIGVLLLAVVYVSDRIALWRLLSAGETAISKLRVRAFSYIHDLSLAEHESTRRGILTARVTSDTETLARFLSWGAITWIRQSAVIVGCLVAMAWYSWQLTVLVTIVYLPLIPVLRFVQQRQFSAYSDVRNSVGETIGLTSEAIAGAATIRSYGYEPTLSASLLRSSQELTRNQIYAHRFFSILSPVLFFFGAAAIGSSMVAAVLLGQDALTVGQFGAFMFLLTILIGPIGQIAEVLDLTQTAMAGWWKIQTLFDIEVDVADPPTDVAMSLPNQPPSVEFRSVGFTYRTGEPVLQDLSFTIKAGSSVALVGETGSGKTTIAKLATRLADPTEGSVLVGGKELRHIGKESRTAAIRMVPQEGFLFDTTIRENIRFGRMDADDATIDAAVADLGLGVWVKRLPQGLDTEVGERGDEVSVGERQLIALIRAQVADAGLLILDEATSSVDQETERSLASALKKMSQNRTTISIAHRMATAERADLILVLKQGRLVAQGSHSELLEAKDYYYDLYHALETPVIYD